MQNHALLKQLYRHELRAATESERKLELKLNYMQNHAYILVLSQGLEFLARTHAPARKACEKEMGAP